MAGRNGVAKVGYRTARRGELSLWWPSSASS